jgi:hypothetical protein
MASRASSQLLNMLPLQTIPGASSTERKSHLAVIEVGCFPPGGALRFGLQRSITEGPHFWKYSRREGRGSSFMTRERGLQSSGLEQRSMTSFCDASTFGSTGVRCRCLIMEGEVSKSDEITITDCRQRRW